MSLEAMMKELAAALDRNTAALTGKVPAKASAAEPKPEAPSTSEKRGPGRPAKPKITSDMIGEKAAELKERDGMPALRALFKENGSPSGKLADLPEANYAKMMAALEAALARGGGDDESEDDDEV